MFIIVRVACLLEFKDLPARKTPCLPVYYWTGCFCEHVFRRPFLISLGKCWFVKKKQVYHPYSKHTWFNYFDACILRKSMMEKTWWLWLQCVKNYKTNENDGEFAGGVAGHMVAQHGTTNWPEIHGFFDAHWKNTQQKTDVYILDQSTSISSNAWTDLSHLFFPKENTSRQMVIFFHIYLRNN